MKLTGRIVDTSIDFISGLPRVTLAINEKGEMLTGYDDIKDLEKLDIELKPHHEKRSLNANAYAWKLITEIANVVRVDKEDIYLRMLQRYGQSKMISVQADIPLTGYIKYYTEAGESTLKGKVFKHYKVYKGSSEFDKREMAILIDGIVTEAKELGIQTETPEEIEKMKSLWEE